MASYTDRAHQRPQSYPQSQPEPRVQFQEPPAVHVEDSQPHYEVSPRPQPAAQHRHHTQNYPQARYPSNSHNQHQQHYDSPGPQEHPRVTQHHSPPRAPSHQPQSQHSQQPQQPQQPQHSQPSQYLQQAPIQAFRPPYAQTSSQNAAQDSPIDQPLSQNPSMPEPNSGLSQTSVYTQYCNLVGIPAPPRHHPFRKAWKKTLYARVLERHRKQELEYWFTASLSTTLLLLQIMIGAVVTALGASRSPHTAITVMGAVNTVVAGVIALMKSRGQPMRARMYRDELGKVLDGLEDAEGMFLGVAEGLDGYKGESYVTIDENGREVEEPVTVREVVEKLTGSFERVVQNATTNYPDFWATSSQGNTRRPAAGAVGAAAATGKGGGAVGGGMGGLGGVNGNIAQAVGVKSDSVGLPAGIGAGPGSAESGGLEKEVGVAGVASGHRSALGTGRQAQVRGGNGGRR